MGLHRFISEKIIYPAGDVVMGTHIVKSLKELERLQWDSAEVIGGRQDELLGKLISHSYANCPYWKGVMGKAGIRPNGIITRADLCKLPILTKDDIRKNISEMTAANIPAKKFRENHSSGSTGEPLKYFDDKEHYSWRIGSVLRFWKWAGFEFGQKWMRVQLWPHKTIWEKMSDIASRCVYVGTYKFDDKALKEGVELLMRKKPEIIRGYTSAIYLLAKYMKDNNLGPFKVKAVITTSESLFGHYREMIEEQFDCKVYDTYGGDGLSISGQCEHGNYHTDDNDLIVEYIRDDGSVAKPGELANIIVTDLRNYAMPFIRYKIQDVGRASDLQCGCGRGLSVMEGVEGRDSDIIKTSDGKYLMVQFFVVFFEYQEGVDQFQIIQRKLDEIEIKVVRNEKLTDADVERIGKSIKEGGGENLKVKFSFVDDIPVAMSGKRRFVISEIED